MLPSTVHLDAPLGAVHPKAVVCQFQNGVKCRRIGHDDFFTKAELKKLGVRQVRMRMACNTELRHIEFAI